jgi:hypothetical protein
MKPIILTGYTSHIAEIAEICLPSKRLWAERHGCELVTLTDSYFPREYGHPSFQKLRWIYHFLVADVGGPQPVIWLDADVMITNLATNPLHLLPVGTTWFAASRDYNDAGRPPHKAWSAGNTAWLPKDGALAWLDKATQDEGARWGGLWDQDALQNCQDEMPFGVDMTLWLARKMNAVHPAFGLPASWQPGDFLIHFTGIAPEDRAAEARKFIEEHLTPATSA